MAQINISGTVSDTLGNPIKGAIVLLKNAGRKDTTDAAGRYAISDQPASILPIKNEVEAVTFDMTFDRSALRVFVSEKQALSIKAYDVSGKNVLTIGKQVFDQGWQTAKPCSPMPPSRVLVVCVNGNNGLHGTRILYAARDGRIGSAGNYQPVAQGVQSTQGAAKRFAVLDTIFVNCRTYKRTVSPIANYSGVSNITMKNWPATSRAMGMKYLPSDTFTMGQNGLVCNGGTAGPEHKVTLSALYIDSTEITEADYQDLIGNTPSYYPGHPTVAEDGCSWYDDVLYCNARSKREGLDTFYTFTGISRGTDRPGIVYTTNLTNCASHWERNGYRLPTEAEWEYAYRGKTTTNTYWNNSKDTLYVWCSDNTGGVSSHTQEVAKKIPNAFHLYDMGGNEWEWTNDFNGDYSSAAQVDPHGPATGTAGQLRGAAYHEPLGSTQFYSAYRNGESRRGASFPNAGFRVVISDR